VPRWKNHYCCCNMVKLLKTPMRGGILILTDTELVLGEGVLGAKNVRRFPLQSLAHLDLLPSPGEQVLRRGTTLRFVWADGQTTSVDYVGPVAARRIQEILDLLRHTRL
jgi:hypothetical protein